jgi:DtxR family Mn-dependent transcriptional regulator
MLSQAVQDYVKTIFNLQKAGNVSTTAIAKALNVSGASVTGMLKRLSQILQDAPTFLWNLLQNGKLLK